MTKYCIIRMVNGKVIYLQKGTPATWTSYVYNHDILKFDRMQDAEVEAKWYEDAIVNRIII